MLIYDDTHVFVNDVSHNQLIYWKLVMLGMIGFFFPLYWGQIIKKTSNI